MRHIVDAPTYANIPYSAAIVAGGLCFTNKAGSLSRTERLKIPHISIAFSGGM